MATIFLKKFSNRFSWMKISVFCFEFHWKVFKESYWVPQWGRVTHICISNLNIIGTDNGFFAGWCQAITWKRLQWNLNRNQYIFFHENATENVVWKMTAILSQPRYVKCSGFINSLCPSDAIWCHRSGSTLAQVMACCLMAPSHYLNQCWLIISEVQWLSSEAISREIL